MLGSIAYKPASGEPSAVAVLTEYVPNEGLAWDLFTSELESVFEVALARQGEPPPPAQARRDGFDHAEPPTALVDVAAQHLRKARQLGVVTGEIHAALATGADSAFAPEPFTLMHQQSLYQRARTLWFRTLDGLERQLLTLSADVREEVGALFDARSLVDAELARIVAEPIEATRIRTHGDLHLGQVLFTGDDFVIIDFEGEPARPLRERRYKRSPLRDVAGMVRSFAYVAESTLRGGRQRTQDLERLRPWATSWASWVGRAYFNGYLDTVAKESFMPQAAPVQKLLLDFHTLEKCIYEIGYELSSRPDWLPIPVRGLLDLLAASTMRT
ncbi:MAG: phosphotransferase [Polyangiaceae bacterium]|nr:phosphotransferase [Polyangiaceae bacterium]